MAIIERYPLQWPVNKPRTLADQRQRAQFHKQVYNGNWNQKTQLTVADAVKRVELELDKYTRVGQDYRIPPESIIISTNVPTGKKGIPLSSMPEPEDPGVAVYFTLDGQPYCFECDKWNRVADNLAAVAAHAARLRDIERYGVGQQHDIYTGFKALPQQAGPSNGTWWAILKVEPYASKDVVKAAWRRLSKIYHPDGTNPDRELYEIIQKAYANSQQL